MKYKKTIIGLRRKIIACQLLLSIILPLLAACSAASKETPAEPVTLRLLLCGSSSGLDRVLEELYAQMDSEHQWALDITFVDVSDYSEQLNSILITHEDYDLVFDAQWLSLTYQIEKGNYLKLAPYFNTLDYPALQQMFAPEYLEANYINDDLYSIPFTSAYYDVPGIFYRRDLLKELDLGFSYITNREQLFAFWDAVAAQGNLVPVSLGSRGFFQLNLPEISLRQQNIWDITGWSFWDYPIKVILSDDNTTVIDVVFPGDSNEHFPQTAESDGTNFLDAFLLRNAECYPYSDPNELLRQDGRTAFINGLSASYESALGNNGSAQVQQQLRQQVAKGEVGFWTYDSAFDAGNRREHNIPVDYTAWNYLCIPKYSKDPEQAIAFLDWLYSDIGRLDLFNYGVEGEDWISIGENEYQLLDNPADAFSFPAFEIAWNPNHIRIDTTLDNTEKDLMLYLQDSSSYTSSPLQGFQLSTNRISIEYASLNAIYSEYYLGFTHGAYEEQTTEKIAELHERSINAGLETVRQELIRQIQEYLFHQ